MHKQYTLEKGNFHLHDEELGLDIQSELGEEEKGYFPGGQLRYILYRKSGQLHGPSLFFNEQGDLLSETWFLEGKKMGKVLRYYAGGKLYCIERFVEGVYHLEQEYYYLDGQIKTLISYRMGKLHGKAKLFWPSGMLKREAHFSEGELDSEEKFYNEEGELVGKTEKSLS